MHVDSGGRVPGRSFRENPRGTRSYPFKPSLAFNCRCRILTFTISLAQKIAVHRFVVLDIGMLIKEAGYEAQGLVKTRSAALYAP